MKKITLWLVLILAIHLPAWAFTRTAALADVINVDPSQTTQLRQIVAAAQPGDVILLTDGTYPLNGDYIWISSAGLSLRSASGLREAVIIDGNYQSTEIITVAASNVTIADLTLRRARTHAIHVVSTDNGDVVNTTLKNLHIQDPGQQAIKINPHADRIHFPDYGLVYGCRIELTDQGRPRIWEINGSCYTGGVDGHQARGWVIRDNIIEGFWCENGLSEHAVHFWTGSRDTLVERNIMIDNARGVGFGLGATGSARTYDDDPCPGADFVGHYDGLIRNNFIFQNRAELRDSEAGFESGVSMDQACGPLVLHNSVISTDTPFSSIEYRFANTSAQIFNNLLSHNLMPRDGAVAITTGNLQNATLDLFQDLDHADLHLKETATMAIDQATPLTGNQCPEDIDRQKRGSRPDIGADEYKTRGGSPWLLMILDN